MTALILNSVLYFEVAAALVALYYLIFTDKEITSLIPIYLLCVVVVEFYGLYSMRESLNNVLWYNILGCGEVCIFSYVFYGAIDSRKHRRWMLLLWVFFVAVLGLELMLGQSPIENFMNVSLGIASIIIVMICCLYIHYIAQTPDVIHLSVRPLTWVCFGLLFYHLCALPITALANNINQIDMDDKLLVIQAIPSIIMYISFILAYIWTQRRSSI